MIRVLLFAGIREAVGTETVILPEEMVQVTVRDVKRWLEEQYPQTKDLLSKSMCAVNQTYANEETTVSNQDEVAFIPPVSGG